MGKAADWLREERRKVLGYWAAVCVECGWARRWFEDSEQDVPERCPECGGVMLKRCPACDSPFASAFAVDCEACGAPLRPAKVHGTRIRRARS